MARRRQALVTFLMPGDRERVTFGTGKRDYRTALERPPRRMLRP